MSDCRENALIVDLASGKGGVAEDAKELCRVMHALSLPGKVAPVSAAQAIYTTVCHMLEEEGLV